MGNSRFFYFLIFICHGFAVSAAPCAQDRVTLTGDFGQAQFRVDVANTGPARSKGLMHVESMPSSTGMLFVYPNARPVAFWMKNTLIPLDMIFSGTDGVVHKVHSGAIPGDLTAIDGGEDTQFVLEINAGLAKAIGIAPGAVMQHPEIPFETAAAPCVKK